MNRALKKFAGWFKNDAQFRFGVIGILVLLLIVMFGASIATHDPYEFGPDSLAAPGENGHILGTNHLGQDVFSMLVYGLRTSLMVALIAALISCVIGIIVGGIGGYFGGKVDVVISEIINIFLMIPTAAPLLGCRNA